MIKRIKQTNERTRENFNYLDDNEFIGRLYAKTATSW